MAQINSNDLEKAKRMLESSSIYVDSNKIINAYNKELELEKDEIFSAENGNFSLSKFSDARKLVSSGAFDTEINSLENKLRNHKYLLQKNEIKDRQMLGEIVATKNKIQLCAGLLDTKRDWYSILNKNLTNGSSEQTLKNMIETYKSLNNSMEEICARNLNDEEFAKKLNSMLEDSANSNSGLDNGGENYKFAILIRKDLLNSLEKNYNKIFGENSFNMELINE